MAKKKTQSDALETVLNDFKSAWEYTSGSWHKRWQDNYFLYNNQRVNYGYEGITNTFVPMTFSTIETLTSALFGTKPKFSFLPPAEKADQKTDILNGLLEFYWDKGQYSIKVINTGRTGLMIGTGVDYFFWDGDYPCMLNIPTRDYFRDPTSSGEKPRFEGRRYLTTKEELESFEVIDLEAEPDEEGGYPMRKKFNNLDKIKADSGSTGDPLDKQEKDMWYGSTVTEPENNQIEVLEYWTEDRVISVANRSVVIQDEENPYKAKAKANGVKYPEGLTPFNWFRDYVDPSLFYAKGEVDFIADEQELLNDITNQNIDAVTFTLNPMFALHPKYAHMVSEIENLPGAVYPVEPDALVPIPMANLPQDAFQERINLKNEIRETTASNEVVKGASQATQATATEINAQIAGAGQRINLKVTQIEDEYFYRMAKIIFSMIKLYVTEPMMVRILGKDGARWEEFDPAKFQGDYEPKVQLDISVENKKQEQAATAKEMMAAFMGDPEINQQELKKLVLQRGFDLEPDEVELLVQPPEMMGMMPGMEGEIPPEMPGELPEEEALSEEEQILLEEELAQQEAALAEEEAIAEDPSIAVNPETGEVIDDLEEIV